MNNPPISPFAGHITDLVLAGDNIWNIIATNDQACAVVLALEKTMQLKCLDKSVQTPLRYAYYRRIFVHVEDPKRGPTQLPNTAHLKVSDQDTLCALDSNENSENLGFQLMHLSMVISQDAQRHFGVLLHGALVERNGKGVILAGPTGIGKTTATRRLPHNWHSYCDDMTLVVCDQKGAYWAHPWPTWSTFMFNGPGGSWDVQHAVPLSSIFFLEQDYEDEFEPLGIAQNVCLLNASAEQSSWLMPGKLEKNALRELRLQRFDNICKLAQTIPSYILRMRLNGSFWQEIERTLNV